jgi:putative transposase
MYARGMTTREIQGHIEEIYGVEASPSLISAITDAVMEEVTAWQNRPLEPCYPIVFMDAIRVNIRSDGAVSNKAVFVALAVLPDGTRDVLGLWFQANEGAKFWAKVLSDLRNRGVQDILIAVVDGLKGFPQAIEAAFPQTRVQTCIVHLLRHSMNFASYKDRKAVAVALKAIYTAVDANAAERALAEFEESDLARRYPAIAPSWRRAWNEVIPFLDYPPEVRRLIYTTNAIEALNSKIRRAVRTRGHFPSDDAAAKLIYLALNATSTEWKRSVREWHAVRSQLAIMFEDRCPMA